MKKWRLELSNVGVNSVWSKDKVGQIWQGNWFCIAMPEEGWALVTKNNCERYDALVSGLTEIHKYRLIDYKLDVEFDDEGYHKENSKRGTADFSSFIKFKGIPFSDLKPIRIPSENDYKHLKTYGEF